VLALGLFLLAPFLAEKFQEPAAVAVIRALALGQFLTGFISIGVNLLYKDLQFRQIVKFEAWGTVLDSLVAVAAAIWWRNVWALVLGTLAGIITRVIASYLLYPGRPQFTFDFRVARQLFGFGQWILLSGLAYFLMYRGTESLSGFFFGAAALGLYQMAARFALIPVHHFGEVFIGTLFPALSLIQADPEKLRGVFLKGIQAGALIIFPLAILIAMVLAPLLPQLLGSQWQGVVPLVQVLALGGAIQAMLRTGPPLFLARGRPDCQFFMNLSSTLGVGLLIFPLSRIFGLEGLAWAYSLGIVMGVPVWWRLVRQHSRMSSRELVVSLSPPLLAAIPMGAIIWLAVRLWPTTFWGFLLAGTLGAAGYLGLIILGERCLPDFKPLSSLLNLIFPGMGKQDERLGFAD
jgi:O-antigen/teichoic acid export membrane protein